MLVAIALLAALLVAGAVVVGVLGRTGGDDPSSGDAGPYAMPAVPAPKAGSQQCASLIGTLPKQLANGKHPLDRRKLATPAPEASAAWGNGDHPVTLRCGVQQPRELTPTSRLLDVSGVQWLEVPAGGSDAKAVTAYAVDRPVYVALTMPTDAGTGPLQNISTTISKTLDAKPVTPSGG